MRRKRIYPHLRAYLADCRRSGITQKAIAAELQISQGHLSDLKKGRTMPSRTLAMRLERECGVPIESFQ